jgi:hypothetical protein
VALAPKDIPLADGSLHGYRYWPNPSSDDIGETYLAFLSLLDGPAHIRISGRDSTRCRAVTTLLHGNEPSGLVAIFNTIKLGVTPAVDMHYFILNVEAAKQPPGFFYRMLPGLKDQNRCFAPPFDDSSEDQLALELLQKLVELNPECLIDVHNTSGSSPAFGVTTFMDTKHNALVSLFTQRIVVTDLSLGSLMEISESILPAVTIECGGAADAESSTLATEGLIKYLTLEDVLTERQSDLMLEHFENPVRLELKPGASIAYANHHSIDHGVTLRPDIENHNFGHVGASYHLGYLSGEIGDLLSAKDSKGIERLDEFFCAKNGELFPTKTLKFFMVTTNPEIAKNDCLLYVVAVEP